MFSEPQVPARLPDEDPNDLAFLYRRYGFLPIEPTTIPDTTLQLKGSAARWVVGLKAGDLDGGFGYLDHFVASVIHGLLPSGHCDLSPTSPLADKRWFSPSISGVVDRISQVVVPELGGAMFMFVPSDSRHTVVLIHDPLTVVEMGRMRVQTDLTSVINYLLRNGSRFTLPSEHTKPMDTAHLRTPNSPTYPKDWVADVSDYQRYMTELKIFLTERPHVAAAALARGGITWRITREVLGLDVDLVLDGTVFEGKALAINVTKSPRWCHDIDGSEWFFLVGGCRILLGQGLQTREVSWWPKIGNWDGCGLDIGCWTPQCEHWFQKRMERILSSEVSPVGSRTWVGYLKYEGPRTKKFFAGFKDLGRRFLADNYPMLSAQRSI